MTFKRQLLYILAIISILGIVGRESEKHIKRLVKYFVDQGRSTVPAPVADLICGQQFEALFNYSQRMQGELKAGRVKSAVVISESGDRTLADLLEARRQKEVEIDRPKTDAETLYPDSGYARKNAEREELSHSHYARLREKFPDLMETCQQTVAKYHRLCVETYTSSIELEMDCRLFYEKRAYWEMVKKSEIFKTFTSKDLDVLRQQFELSFEDDLKRRVAKAKEAAPN